jgi:hypothetical protein
LAKWIESGLQHLTPRGAALPFFEPVTSSEVAAAIARLPDKSSVADPITVPILKQVADLMTPFLTHLFNRSIEAGQFCCLL